MVAKWGVKRGERTYKARDGRELCEGNEWDNELISEYPGLNDEEWEERGEYRENRAGGVMGDCYDIEFGEGEIERVIRNLKKKEGLCR